MNDDNDATATMMMTTTTTAATTITTTTAACHVDSTTRPLQAEAVDECTEYLVPMPTLVSLAAEHGMALEYASNFTDIFAAEMHEVRVP